MHRVATLTATLSLFGVSFATWATVIQVPLTGAIAVLGLGAGLALVVAALVVRDEHLGRVDLALTVLGLILLAGWATSNIYLQPGYGTDEAAFEQYAASLLLHGHDPYHANLAPALNQFRVPIQYATYLLGGGMVHTLGYPALSVLVTAAFIPLTHGVQSVVIANVVALGATCLLAFLLLPRPWKGLAALLTIGLPILFGYSVAGVNAILMGLPLVVVAWRWTETGRHGRRLNRRDIVRGCACGLAAATQQLAWFIALFVLIGIWRLRRADRGPREARRIVVAHGALAGATFVLINLPFIVWSPGAWLSGLTSTLTQQAIPYGQGLVDAALFFHTGGGGLLFYTLAGALLYAGLLGCYTARLDKLGMACFVLPVIPLFLTTRSLAEYFMVLVAVWAISLLTTRPDAFKDVRPALVGRGARLRLAVLFVPALAAIVLAFTLPAPLHLAVLSVRTNGELQGVWELRLAVTNTSGHRLTPQFEVNYIGQASTFFHQIQGPAALAPRQRAIYTLDAPNRGSMPGITTPFVVVATTAHPQTVSVSSTFVPQPFEADLEPGYVNQIVGRGGSTTFRVDLRSPFGSFIHKPGVRIALGQVVYGQDALIDAQASINGRPEGQTPVYTSTDDAGVATFRITDPQPQGQPVYFQAWIAGSYPYGYSAIVPVEWAG